MGFGVEGFLGVEGRFFYTRVFEAVASTASLAFFGSSAESVGLFVGSWEKARMTHCVVGDNR